MKKLLLSLITLVAFAQTPPVGTVTYTPPAPAKLVAVTPETTPVITVTVTGNALPATGITFNWKVNGVSIPAFTMPLAAGQSYTSQQNFGTDAVTVLATADSTGKITVNATANGSPQGGGVF